MRRRNGNALSGFKYAGEGFLYAVRTQKHMKFHAAAAAGVLLTSAYSRLEPAEWLWIILAIALVWSAELMNTAVEHAVDLASPERHPYAKAAKDTAAAGVLVVSIFSLAVAFIILIPALFRIWTN